MALPLDTFGPSSVDPHVDRMLQNLVQQRAMLQGPINAVAQTLGNALSATDQPLQAITSTLNKQVNAAVKRNGKAINSVLMPLATQIAAQQGETQSQLNTVMAAAGGPPRPIACNAASGFYNATQGDTYILLLNCQTGQLVYTQSTQTDLTQNYESQGYQIIARGIFQYQSDVDSWLQINGPNVLKECCSAPPSMPQSPPPPPPPYIPPVSPPPVSPPPYPPPPPPPPAIPIAPMQVGVLYTNGMSASDAAAIPWPPLPSTTGTVPCGSFKYPSGEPTDCTINRSVIEYLYYAPSQDITGVGMISTQTLPSATTPWQTWAAYKIVGCWDVPKGYDLTDDKGSVPITHISSPPAVVQVPTRTWLQQCVIPLSPYPLSPPILPPAPLSPPVISPPSLPYSPPELPPPSPASPPSIVTQPMTCCPPCHDTIINVAGNYITNNVVNAPSPPPPISPLILQTLLPPSLTPPERKPNIRVMGAGDERPDDEEINQALKKFKEGAIPIPGSKDWCLIQGEIANALAAVGNAAVDYTFELIKKLRDAADSARQVQIPTITLPNKILDAIWQFVSRALGKASFEILDDLVTTIATAKKLDGSGLICNASIMIGLVSLRAIFDVFKHTRVGWDAVLWTTVDLTIELPSVSTMLEYLINALCPYTCPEPHRAIEALVQNLIDEKTYKCWMNAHAADVDVWNPVLMSQREQPVAEERIQWARRHKMDEKEQLKQLRWAGFIDSTEAALKLELYDELPTINDHLHWLQRNVFDKDYIADYHLLDGFADDKWIQTYLGDNTYKQGRLSAKSKFWDAFGHDLHALGMKQEYAALHYASHWINPSPGQLFEMVRRLRPGRVDDSVKFTEEDLLRLLAEQDVAPYFRERFRQIAYVPYGLRFLRQLYDTRQIDNEELKERYMDLGYREQDADSLSDSDKIRRARTVATQVNGYTAKNIRTLFMAGKLKTQEVLDHMKAIGYPAAVAREAIQVWQKIQELKQADDGGKAARSAVIRNVNEMLQVGVIDINGAQQVLIAQGFSAKNAQAYATALVSADRMRITKTGIDIIRKGVLTGRLAMVGASALLAHLGIVQAKIDEYINIWTYQFEAGKKQVSAALLVKKAGQGLISMADARQRLLNMGYDDPDNMLLLSDATITMQKAEQQALAAQAKAQMAQAKAVMQAQLRAKQALAKMQQQLNRLGSPSKIIAWYRAGQIGPKYARARLLALGISATDVDIALETAAYQGGTKRGKTPITPNQPGVEPTAPPPGS